MNSQPSKHPQPERMRPFFPILNKNPSPISELEDSTQVAEQGQCPTHYPDPRQHLVLEPLRQQRPRSRLDRWLCQLCNNRRPYLVIFPNVLCMQDIKRRRQVPIGQMLKLYRDQLSVSLSTTSFRADPVRFDRCIGPDNDNSTSTT